MCQKAILIRLDLKTCWFAVTCVCFLEYTRPVRNKLYHFEMEKKH